jgi:outer membrane protein OmpA-like peptidoglycan-associated protein
VIVEGFTDGIGSRAYNQELSRRRALSVRDALVANGVPNGKVYLSAFGEDTPIPGPAANARRVRIWGQLPSE